MKTFFTILIFILTVTISKAATFVTKNAVGGWSAATSWSITAGTDSDGIPDNDDDVTILGGHVINLTITSRCKSLTLNPTSKINGNTKALAIFNGDLINNGTLAGNFSLYMQGAGKHFTTSTPYTCGGTLWIQKTCTISSGTVINKSGRIVLQNANTKVYNFGKVTTYNSGAAITDGNVGMEQSTNRWINEPGSSLKVNANCSVPTNGFDCAVATNTVEFAGKCTDIASGLYYDLLVSSLATKNLTLRLSVLNNLKFSAGAANITNTNGKSIAVGGNVTFDAVVNFNTTDTLVLRGSSGTQTIAGTAYTKIDNLNINNTGTGVLFNTRQAVTNDLIMTNGNLNSGSNKLFLESTASTTARIAPITATASISFSGTMVIQKFLPADAGSDYPYFAHDISSPVQNTVINDWDNELFISGIGNYDGVGGPAGVDGDVYNGYQSFTHYDEPTNSYVALTGSSTPLNVGTGYTLLLLDVIDGATLDGSFSNKVMDSRGLPNYGDINVPVTVQSFGWNIVGNPYASAITLTTGVTSTGILPTYIYFTEFGNYTYEDIDYPIAPHQGFLLEMQGASDEIVTFTEDCKLSDHTSAFRRTKAKYDIQLNISSNVSAYHHEAHINFNDMANVNYDAKLDAKYLQHPSGVAPAIYMIDEEKNVTLLKNMVSDAPDQLAIPLGIFTPKTGVYYIDAKVLNMGGYNFAWIENKVTGATYDINSVLPVQGTEKGTNKDYILHLVKSKQNNNSISKTLLDNDLIVFSTENTINLKSSYTDHTITEVLVYDMTGKLMLTETNMSVVAGVISKIDVTNLSAGIYVVKVTDDQGRTTSSKLIK
ncbi:MAG: T9SS type A sorting domain-containing protein [Bacteroidota bacterium]